MTCPSCGTENREGRKFCSECGTALASACPSCGAANEPGEKFCGECGASLTASPARVTSAPLASPAAERRLVSMLFADLVGFTAASEDRDAEDTRELLTRYFDTARVVIERYGGTVEKFIGDAVMALWGAPVAQEDDAERAVRAALDLVAAVPELDPRLQARAGVLTGEAAVTVGAEGQGMVAGDLVNTASRIQSAAEPGTVLVGEATKRSAEAAIVFEDAGSHSLKGKSEPTQLWRAVRVTGLRGGAARPAGLEPPFVGRDRELRLVKELYHASAEDQHSNLISVVGIGGIGKSRLAWEFEKYIDGLAGEVWWHSGRCLAYGDGVAFWALAEMVRGRAGIAEDEESASARAKLRTALEEHLVDPQERKFVEPRLAHLLGLEEGAVAEAMEVLLTGPVPGLPEELRNHILERAEGVPFYAVETVRMLLDRGVLVREGHSYRLTGEIETLEVPETLQALIAARLDGLAPDERRVAQHGSVLGRTFTLRGLSAVSGLGEPELESLLASLVRKEIVSLTSDPLSPERGQYGFLQDLVKKVAYDTLSRKERKALHLAAAEHLRSLGDDDELVEVLAAHYVDAYRAAPDDSDATEIRDRARTMVVRAAERAASLAADQEAQHAYERAIELTNDPLVQADLHEHAGLMARTGARSNAGEAHFERAIALFETAGATHPAARVSARLAEVMWDRGRLEHGLEIMDRSYEVLSEEEPDADLAALAAQLGRFMFFAGQHDLALQRIETALDIAEALSLPEVLAQALTTKAMLLIARGRHDEGLALMRFGLDTALEHDKPSAALRASYNLADTLSQIDRYSEAVEQVRVGLARARRIGNRYWELSFLSQLYPMYACGEWDELAEMIEQLPQEEWRDARQSVAGIAGPGVLLHAHRGDLDEAARLIALFEEIESSADVQERAVYACGKARLRLAEGDAAEALRIAEIARSAQQTLGFTQEYVKELDVTAAEAALALSDTATLAALVAAVDAIPPGRSSHFLRAHSARFRAHLADRAGDPESADRLFRGAIGLYREIETPFHRAVVLLEHAEWLARQAQRDGRDELVMEAREIFERLGAAPWLERAERIAGAARVPA